MSDLIKLYKNGKICYTDQKSLNGMLSDGWSENPSEEIEKNDDLLGKDENVITTENIDSNENIPLEEA